MKIDVFKMLATMQQAGPGFAQAKAKRIYLEQYAKTLKAELMMQAASQGVKTASDREAYAYAHERYRLNTDALQTAVETEERLRWELVHAQTSVDVWRSAEASNRAIDRGAA